MAISRTDVAAQLERGMRVGFVKGTRDYTPKRSAFAREVGSDGAFETYADMGSTPWPRQNGGQTGAQGTNARTGAQVAGGLHEGGPITVLGGNERSLDVYNQDWDVPIGIWHNAINDNRVGSLEAWARNAGSRFEQHKDYLCFNALNVGAANTYGLAYDGLVFFSASHVDPNAEYQTVQSNVNTSTLSLDNYETIRVAGANFLDDRGQPVGLSHDLLIVPPALERTAAQIARNAQAYDTANREMNPYQGVVSYLTSPGGYLDSTAWFAVDTSIATARPIILQTRQNAMLEVWDDFTQGGGIRYFKWHARYTVFYGDWRLAIQGNT